ncbi:hypothetical protein IFM89_016612 [Coptis chinensis]|uniref:Piwi domain-containing protein n=1 Tax=Coptis chinensis TaxID=261450 RepID=A0A835IT30_9MAGN|nr:hypothetical protein IFM89_016612 [Coptis chinensis]
MTSPKVEDAEAAEALPPPPPLPDNVVPIKAEVEYVYESKVPKIKRLPMSRPGFARKGQPIQLLTNHFGVNVKSVDGDFYHYSVSLSYDDDRPVEGKGIGRKVIDKLHECYADTELGGKDFAYDGEKTLFTVGPLPQNKHDFTVVLEDISSNRAAANGSPKGSGSPDEGDRKRFRRPFQSKTFKVAISFAAKIPMKAIALALRGQESENSQDALRVLDIILRQHAAKQGCLLVRQSFFHNNPRNFCDLGGGVLGCRGFHSSFRATHGGLSLNIDVSTTMIIQPGPVVDFLIANQNVRDPYGIDWAKLCNLVSLQRYTKALSTLQRSSLVEKSRQKPQERMSVLSDALKTNKYDSDKMLQACGVSINSKFTQIDGRVLSAPKLKVGNGEDFMPRNGRWNFNNKKLLNPVKIERWAIVNFSARCDVQKLWRDLAKCGQQKGILVNDPFTVIEENPSARRESPLARVENMFEQIKAKLPMAPQFLLCLLPERKTSAIYGPWKRKNLADFGIVTQCIAPTKVNDQYLTNVLLKINAKLGGLNATVECSPSIPMVSKVPTIILGMDVSHGSPGQSDVPSIAAVVSSRRWPSISRYRASVRTQSPKVEMIDNLFKPVSDTVDEGIIRELLLDFYHSSEQRKPDHIIIFSVVVVLVILLFFPCLSPPPTGTVIDSKICHPRNNDFYMCSHAGMIGTTRPTHYHVLYDEIGFSPDDLQELVHSLSYVYQRSTTAISIVAPVCYAHLAAAQVSQFMKFDEMSEASSGRGGLTSAGTIPVPELPKLHENVSSSMFFC